MKLNNYLNEDEKERKILYTDDDFSVVKESRWNGAGIYKIKSKGDEEDWSYWASSTADSFEKRYKQPEPERYKRFIRDMLRGQIKAREGTIRRLERQMERARMDMDFANSKLQNYQN